MGIMKTTLDIQDELLARAKRHAQRTGRPLRAVVEEGLRQVLITLRPPTDATGCPTTAWAKRAGRDPLEAYSWQDLREVIYAEPESR